MRQKLKYGFVFLGLMVHFFTGKGQIHPETAFYWENPSYISPAYVNLDYRAFFSLAARKQWAGLKGSPSTFFATGALYWEDYHMQGGAKMLKDKIGYLNTLDFSLSYAYVVRLNWNSFLNLGVAGAYQTQSVDRNEVLLDDKTDPALQNERFRGLKNWNANLGVEYVFDKTFIAGIAAQNLFSFFRNESQIWGGTNYFYARYRTRSLGRSFDAGRYRTRSFQRSYDMEYGVCVKQYEEDIQVDGMISLYVNRNTQEEKLQFSLFGRSVGEVGVLIGFKLPNELKVLCTYDYNFKEIGREASGSFEVMLTYPIRRSSVCRSRWDR